MIDRIQPLVLEIVGIGKLQDDTDDDISGADGRILLRDIEDDLSRHGEDRAGNEDAEGMPPEIASGWFSGRRSTRETDGMQTIR
jgi:hypothetical protein